VSQPNTHEYRDFVRSVTARFIPAVLVSGCLPYGSDGVPWYDARRDPTGLAPDPATTPEAVIQVCAARAVSWRGVFSMHTWIAVKLTGAPLYALRGARLRRCQRCPSRSHRPDGPRPDLLGALRRFGIGAQPMSRPSEGISCCQSKAHGPEFFRFRHDRRREWPLSSSGLFLRFTAIPSQVGPRVRIRLPPAVSLQTPSPSSEMRQKRTPGNGQHPRRRRREAGSIQGYRGDQHLGESVA
jgi:hypothetical protein